MGRLSKSLLAKIIKRIRQEVRENGETLEEFKSRKLAEHAFRIGECPNQCTDIIIHIGEEPYIICPKCKRRCETIGLVSGESMRHRNAAENALLNGHIQRAIDELRQAVANSELFGEAHYLLSEAYMQIDDPESALIHATKAIDCDETDGMAYNNRGVANISLNRLNKAKADFQKSIELHPDNHQARLNLGIVKLKLGAVQKAKAEWEEVIRLAPNCDHARQARDALAQLEKL